MPAEVQTTGIGVLTGFVACLVGWQINLLVIHRGIDRGRIAAFAVGVGAVAADLLILLLGFTGLSPFKNHPELWEHLKWLAVGMMLLIAVRSYVRKRRRRGLMPQRRDPAKNFLLGFLVVITNPLVFLIWIAVLSFLVAHFPGARILQLRALFLASFSAGALAWFLFVSLWVLSHARKWPESRLHLISRVMSVAIAAVAVTLLFAKI